MKKTGFTFGDIVRGSFPSLKKSKESFEECVHNILKKEGGAAGVKAIKAGLEAKGYSTENLAAQMKKVPKVVQHKNGDYIFSDIGSYKK